MHWDWTASKPTISDKVGSTVFISVHFCGSGAMRVAAESRRSFREALEVSGLRCTFDDAALRLRDTAC